MKIVIMGGTGLIGTALTADLVRDGNEVIVLTRSPQRRPAGFPAQARLVGWDGRSAAGWAEHVAGSDALVNLVGENLAGGRWTAARKRRILESRTQAGKAVVEAVRLAQPKPRLVLQASAIGYYGTDPRHLYREDDPSGTSFENRVVQAWEESSRAVEELGVRRVVARLAVVFSTRGGALPRMLLPFKLFAGGPLGSGRQPVSWIHIDDLVAALRFFITHAEAKGVYNVAAPQTLTNAELAHCIGRVMRRPAFIPAPAFAIRLVFGEMATVVLDGRRVAADKLQSAGFTFRYPQAEAALQHLLENKR